MIDLHIHTTCSDGTDTVIELLKKAEEKNLKVISITDHNTVKAYEILEEVDVIKYYTGKIIVGVELNTKMLNVPIEILGYGFDYKKIKTYLEKTYLSAVERNKLEFKRLYEKCVKAGIKIDSTSIEQYDGSKYASKAIHAEIQKHEENKKYISEDCWENSNLFYRKYMSNPECILYVDIDDIIPDFETAANIIRECGGIVFLPHIFEYKENSEKILEYILSNYSIDGMECYYTTFSKEQNERLIKLCEERELYMSGGSDYHGTFKPDVELGTGYGTLQIEDGIIEKWLKSEMCYTKY